MNRVYRLIALALTLMLALGLLSGCASQKTDAEAFAITAWQVSGRTDKPSSVGCIHYTAPAALSSRMEVPADGVAEVPNCGYAYVFAPNGTGYDGLVVVFIDETGNVISTMDYDTLYLSYASLGDDSPVQKTALLNTCNYLAFMYAELLESGTPMTADARTNQWNVFSQDQLKAITR